MPLCCGGLLTRKYPGLKGVGRRTSFISSLRYCFALFRIRLRKSDLPFHNCSHKLIALQPSPFRPPLLSPPSPSLSFMPALQRRQQLRFASLLPLLTVIPLPFARVTLSEPIFFTPFFWVLSLEKVAKIVVILNNIYKKEISINAFFDFLPPNNGGGTSLNFVRKKVETPLCWGTNKCTQKFHP